MLYDPLYFLFRSKETSELVAVINLYHWFNANQRFSDEGRAMAFLNDVFEMKKITIAEKETYCDVFGIVPVYDILDVGVISMGWKFLLINEYDDRDVFYWEFCGDS